MTTLSKLSNLSREEFNTLLEALDEKDRVRLLSLLPRIPQWEKKEEPGPIFKTKPCIVTVRTRCKLCGNVDITYWRLTPQQVEGRAWWGIGTRMSGPDVFVDKSPDYSREEVEQSVNRCQSCKNYLLTLDVETLINMIMKGC